MSLGELTPELAEWIYGPALDEDDEPLSVGAQYRIQEEEDRFRWIPGYRETVEAYLAALHRWQLSWDRVSPYPDEPADVRDLKARVSELQRIRAEPPGYEK